MRKLLPYAIAVALLSCSRTRTAKEPFPDLLAPDHQWITYEGVLPSASGHDVLVELHLSPAAPGMDSYFKMTERLGTSRNWPFAMSTSSQGTYSVLIGAQGHYIVKMANVATTGAFMLGRLPRPAERVTRDLLLKSNGDHELLMVDEDFRELAPRYRLLRRSDLFTVEGYFTVYPEGPEYFEKNTLKKWRVADFACYTEADSGYHALAKEKFEGVYLKALSYSIRQPEGSGNEGEMLVFKRILQMGTAEGI